jgi:Ca2+-transporting ATPase
LARSTEEDKLILVDGLRKEGSIVSMSGEGVSDAIALKMANVGLCMG